MLCDWENNRRPGGSNGSLLPGGLLIIVTCGLTACTPGSTPGPTIGNEYGKPLTVIHQRIFPSEYDHSGHTYFENYYPDTIKNIHTRLTENCGQYLKG